VVRVRAWNRQGAGGPVWYTQQGADDAQLATPLCADGIEACVEPREYNYSIIPRALVNAPPFAIPLAGAITSGSGKDVEPRNSFTKNSLQVTFGLPNQTFCAGANVTAWKVEWDTLPTFDSRPGGHPLSFVNGSSPVVRDRADPYSLHALGSGQYNITGLEMGVRYYVRVTAFNSLGFGAPALYQDAVPCVSPDAPGLPTTLSRRPDATTDLSQAASLAEEAVEASKAGEAGRGGLGGLTSQERATSLDVSWGAPRLSAEFEDPNGAGGDPVDSYVVQWSKRPFSTFNDTVQTIALTCPGGGRLAGRFRLLHNTSGQNTPASLFLGRSVRTGLPIADIHVSTDVEAWTSAWDMRTILMNMVNVGDVAVEGGPPTAAPRTGR